VQAIREALSHVDDLVVVIGSAELSHTPENPFTAGERYQMFLSTFDSHERARMHLIPLRDVNRYSTWVNHVESYAPPFDVVFSNSDLTRSLFAHAGYEASKTRSYNVKLYSGTEVRRRIAAGERWHHLVPEPVAKIVEGLDGKRRLIDAGLVVSARRKKRAR